MKPENVLPIDLPKSCMAFKLLDGNLLFIHNEDVKKIASELTLMALTDLDNPNLTITKRFDSNLDKINKIQEILTTNSDMSGDLKDSFHKELLKLILKPGDIRDEVSPLYEKKL